MHHHTGDREAVQSDRWLYEMRLSPIVWAPTGWHRFPAKAARREARPEPFPGHFRPARLKEWNFTFHKLFIAHGASH
jgi:hypothetical protein